MIASLLFWLCSPLCLDETGHESDQHAIIAGFVGYPILNRQIGLHSRSLNLLEPALLQSHATAAVPLDQGIIIVKNDKAIVDTYQINRVVNQVYILIMLYHLPVKYGEAIRINTEFTGYSKICQGHMAMINKPEFFTYRFYNFT